MNYLLYKTLTGPPLERGDIYALFLVLGVVLVILWAMRKR